MTEQRGTLDLIHDGRPGMEVLLTLPAAMDPALLIRVTSVVPQPVWPRQFAALTAPVGV